MTIILYLPDFGIDFGNVSVGVRVAGSLIIAFLILALGFGIYRMSRMRRRMDLLDDETRTRRAQGHALEEELCGVGPCQTGSSRTVSRQKKDPWQN